MTLRYQTMDMHDALYTVARAYPGGLDALYPRLGITSVNVLRNKVRPAIRSHYVSNEEDSLIMEFAEEAGVPDALQPLIAKNNRHNMIAFRRPPVDTLTDDDLTQCLCRAMKEFSDLTATASRALADKKITEAELDEIEKEAQEALAAIGELRERMRRRARGE